MTDEKLLRRWVFTMPPRVHPCLCGFESATYPQMKRHRRKCHEWQARPNPREISIVRRRESRQDNSKVRVFMPCPACGGRPDHHEEDCPHSQGEFLRREAILKNDIDPRIWTVFLRELAKKYARGWDS